MRLQALQLRFTGNTRTLRVLLFSVIAQADARALPTRRAGVSLSP